MSEPIPASNGPKILRFLYLCFRQGVVDASEHGSDIDSREFYERKREDWSFGTLEYQDNMDWEGFRATLYWWARRAGMKSLAEGYIFRIRNRNYTWCLLPYAMRFYLMGVSEWLSYPNRSKIELFKHDGKGHWDVNSPIKQMTKPDIISYMHIIEHEFKSLGPEMHMVSPTAMSTFISVVYGLNRKYGR